MFSRVAGVASASVFAVALVTGCAGTPPTATPVSSVNATQVPATVGATLEAGPTTAPTVASTPALPNQTAAASASLATATKALPRVNLTFSGTSEFTAIGSAGRCSLIKDASGSIKGFGFEATEADYPGLGLSYSMAQFTGNDYVDIKWVLNEQGDAYARPGPAQGGKDTVTLSADRRGVTLDVDLAGLHAAGRPEPGPEHVSGTITCP